MAKYKIYLVKLGGATVGNEARAGAELKSLFDQVIDTSETLGRRFSDGAEVLWSSTCPDVAGHELLIYVVPSSDDSIVKDMPALRGRAAPSGSDAGFTAWAEGLTASEIFPARGTAPAMVAKLAFHEAMHNKMHSGSDLHGQNGLAVSPLDPSSTLSADNKRRMARVLGTNRRQWTGGCMLYNDPMRGL